MDQVLIRSVPIWVMAFLAMGLGALVAGLGGIFVHRRWSPKQLAENNEIAGFKLGVVGLVFGIVLGMAVVAVWEDYSDALSIADAEATAFAAVARNSEAFSQTDANSIREALTAYGRGVIDQEYAAGQAVPEVSEALTALTRIYARLAPSAGGETVFLDHSLDALDRLAEARQSRLIKMKEGMPEVIWAILLAGSVVTVGLTLFLGSENRRAQRLMTMILGATIGLGLFTVLELDHPFEGHVRVGPDALEHALEVHVSRG